jgi:osmotically-inducible protein OsmY
MANRDDRGEQWNREEWRRDEGEQQDWGIRRYRDRDQRGRSAEYDGYGGGGYGGYAGRREGGYGEQRGAWSQRVYDADERDDDRSGAVYRAVGGSGMGYGNASQARPSRRSGYSRRGPKGYTRSDDRIREDVCDRLSLADDVDASDISVTVCYLKSSDRAPLRNSCVSESG